MNDPKQQDAVLHEAQAAVEWAMDGMSKLDDAGQYRYVNPRYAALLGYQPDELIGQSWEMTVHADDRARAWELLERMLVTGRAEGELRRVKKDGSLFYEHMVIIKPDPREGKTPGHYCFATDITERQVARDRERASQRLLTAIIRVQSLFIDEVKPEAVWGLLLEELLQLTHSEYGFIGEIVRSAEGLPALRTYAITGIAWDDETRALLARQAPPLEFRNLKTLFGQVMTSGQPVIANDPTNDSRASGLPPGHPPMRAFLGLPFFHGGVMTGMVGITNRPGGYDEQLVAYLQPLLGICGQLAAGFRNKLRQDEAEQALRASEDRFRVAMQGANDGIWDWDLRSNEVYFSERWKNMLGYQDHEIASVYSEWESRLHPDDRARVLFGLTDYLQNRQDVYDVEFRIRKKDDTYCWVHARGKAVWDAEGRPYRMAGSHTDITERKREEALQVAEKHTLELVAKGDSLKDVLTFLCRAIEAHTAPMLSSIMLVTEDGAHLSAMAGPSLSDEYNRLVDRIPIGPTVGSCGSAAYYREPAIVCDIATDPLWKDYANLALSHGLAACWSQPIVSSSGILLGTLAAYFREPKKPQPRDLRLMEQAGHIAALAIEHTRALEALKESEERFRLMFMSEPECVKTVAPDGMLLAMNPAGLRVIEAASLEEVVGRSVLPLIHSDDRSAFWEAHCAAVSGSAGTLQFRVIGLKGQLRWMEMHSVPLRDAGGTITAVLSVARDVTERKKLEQASQHQTDRLRLAMDIAGLATWDWNILTNEVLWSENCEDVKGLPKGSFDGTFQGYQRLVHPEDLPRLLADIEDALSGQKPYRTEHRIVAPTGEMQWIEGNGVVYRDQLGRPVRMVGTVRNITERKANEQAIKVNEDRYARATAVGRVGVWELDVRSGTYYGDKNLKEMFGYRVDELSTDPFVWLRIVHPDDQAIAMAHWQRIVSRETDDYHYELRMIRKDGTVIWTDVRGHAVRDADGQVTQLIGATVDITDRKQTEEHLRRTQFAMDQAVDAVYWIDARARILYSNEAASAMLGYSADELRRMTVHDLNPDFPAEVWPGFWAETREKRIVSRETVHLAKDGRRIPIDIRVSFLAHGGQEFHCAFVRDISKRKEVEEAAQRSLTLLQSVLHTAPIRVFWKDCESRYLGCNHQFALDTGCTDAQEIIGKTDDDLVWHGQAARYQADDRWVMESGCAKLGFEEPGTTVEGGEICLRTSKVPLRDEHGCVIGVLGVYEDITEKKRLDEALLASQERFELAAHATNDGIWDWNIPTGEQYWSDRHLELFGLRPGDLTPTYDMWIALVHPDDAELVHQATCRHLERREPYDLEVRVRLKDGSYRWFRDRGQAVWDASGRPIRMVGSISDVTERRLAEETIWKAHAELEQRVVERTKELALANRALEEEIRERELAEGVLRLTQFTVDRAAYGILWVSRNADICYANDAACRLLGYEREELLDMTVHQIDPNFPPGVWSVHWEDLKRRGTFTFESSQRTKSGRVHYTEVTVNYLEYEGVEYHCAIVRDITERKVAEEAVRESELRYKLLSDATFDGIAVHDQGLILEVNPGLERMYGYDSGELIGKSIMDLVADESRETVIANMRAGMKGPYEGIGRRKDGSTFHGEVVVRPYRYRGKEVRLVAGRDITARKHLEEERTRYLEILEGQVAERTAEIAKLESQRAQVEKLAAMGRLAAGVAHEINNPIAGIKNAFTLVRQAVDPDHPNAEFAGLIDREIGRVASIIQNMYQLCRPATRKAERVDLWSLAKDLDILLTPQLQQRRLKFIAEMGGCSKALCVPRGDLVQVLLNLLTNAIDCSPEGGTITFILREETEGLRLSVQDQGPGITQENLTQIFDPFFTTKTDRDQKGMGLGLSISQNLVQAMGGEIEVATQLGEGSTFTVLLPHRLVEVNAPDRSNIIKEVVTHDC